jgi:hypothetical protein
MRVADRDAGLAFRKRAVLSIRSWIACGGWTIILFMLSLLAVLSSELEIQVLLALLVVYGIQGCAVELIGVKIEPSGISFPNRVFPSFPYLVLLRSKLPRKSFSRVDFIRRHAFVIYPAMRQIIVPVTKSCDQRSIVRFLKETFPDLSVTIIQSSNTLQGRRQYFTRFWRLRMAFCLARQSGLFNALY